MSIASLRVNHAPRAWRHGPLPPGRVPSSVTSCRDTGDFVPRTRRGLRTHTWQVPSRGPRAGVASHLPGEDRPGAGLNGARRGRDAMAAGVPGPYLLCISSAQDPGKLRDRANAGGGPGFQITSAGRPAEPRVLVPGRNEPARCPRDRRAQGASGLGHRVPWRLLSRSASRRRPIPGPPRPGFVSQGRPGRREAEPQLQGQGALRGDGESRPASCPSEIWESRRQTVPGAAASARAPEATREHVGLPAAWGSRLGKPPEHRPSAGNCLRPPRERELVDL
ncbi:translation initiation factor IF-2 [Myotis daubentonii]|uniref:translation initiation factor IF-2 n=1 Tax=Myotis daubentonii TaxID=98922 RepID=UPI002873639B|nr:translation initiation factor IF-2 [Myotis daubentonii]